MFSKNNYENGFFVGFELNYKANRIKFRIIKRGFKLLDP